MDFGQDFTEGHVPGLNTFYSGHYWSSTRLDMNNNDDYAQDPNKGKHLNPNMFWFSVVACDFYDIKVKFMCNLEVVTVSIFTSLKPLGLSLQGIMEHLTGCARTPSVAGSALLSVRRS